MSMPRVNSSLTESRAMELQGRADLDALEQTWPIATAFLNVTHTD